MNPLFAVVSCAGVQLSVKLGPCGTSSNPIYNYLEQIINLAGGVLGIIVVVAIVIAGFQYITSAGNPDAVKAAKKRLGQAILGLVLWLLMFGILEVIGLKSIFG